MKIIDFPTIARLEIAPKTCYQWAESMIAAKGRAILPPKISMKPAPGVFCNVMPSVLPPCGSGRLWGGVKIVTRYPDRQPALESRILLYDMESGECLALMDANWITAMRTGAVAAHSILCFAKKGFRNISMIGLGNTARAALLILSETRPEREFEIRLLRYKEQEELFMRRFANRENLRFSCVDNIDTLVKGADVLLSCVTYLEKDVCPDNRYEEGILIVPVHTRGFTNCDLFFDKVYADDRGHVCHFQNFEKFRSFAEVSDVLNGKSPGRESDRERILAYNIGISLHDVYFAARIYEMLRKDADRYAALPDISLHEPEEKFWV